MTSFFFICKQTHRLTVSIVNVWFLSPRHCSTMIDVILSWRFHAKNSHSRCQMNIYFKGIWMTTINKCWWNRLENNFKRKIRMFCVWLSCFNCFFQFDHLFVRLCRLVWILWFEEFHLLLKQGRILCYISTIHHDLKSDISSEFTHSFQSAKSILEIECEPHLWIRLPFALCVHFQSRIYILFQEYFCSNFSCYMFYSHSWRYSKCNYIFLLG